MSLLTYLRASLCLNKVQMRASIAGLRQKRDEMQYEEGCAIFKWSPFDKRRLYFTLIKCFISVFSLNNLVYQYFFELAYERSRSNYNFKLRFKGYNINSHKYSFLEELFKIGTINLSGS